MAGSGPVVTFSVYGHKQIERELLRFSARAADASPAWHTIVHLMKEDIKEQFDTEGASMSGGWPPDKPVTIERKAAMGLRTETMRATDRLMTSLTDEANSDQVVVIDPHGFEFKSLVDYGAYHMGPSADGTRPARPPVDFTEIQRRKYIKELQGFLVGI
jgi:hypothetical protein